MNKGTPAPSGKSNAVILAVVMFGLVSCFGDVIYEGARSANGQYFSLLAVNATAVGVLYGVGEFLGYALRLVSGKLSDATGKHWVLIFIGYGALITVPLMGMTRSIPMLFFLFLIERIGKALRNPPKDTILSQVAENRVGTGFVFGLQLVAFILLMAAVFIAYRRISKYELVRVGESIHRESDRLTPIFWVYCLFAFLASFGLVAYSIVGFHLKAGGVLPDAGITALYAVAMVVDAVMALVIGHIYDRIKQRTGNRRAGLLTLAFIPPVTAAVPFLALGHSAGGAVAGLVLYGIVLGTHETIMRSAIADLTAFHKRGTAYGIFNAIYGLGLFCGSAVMGALYDHASVAAICAVVLVAEGAAFAVFLRLKKEVYRTDAV